MEHMNVYTTGCLMDYQVFPFSLVMFSVVFFHRSEPVQVVSHSLRFQRQKAFCRFKSYLTFK